MRRGKTIASVHSPASGYTLIEMAVVLVVIGLIIYAIFPAMNAMRAASQRAATQNNLDALMKATAAYVQANGCLPCPTPAVTVGGGFGRVTGGATAAACGACTTPEGIPPFVSLGLPASTASDGWGHWITMRVDPGLTGNTNFTVVTPPSKPVMCTCSAPSGTACAPSPSAPLCSCAAAVNGSCAPNPPGPTSQQGLCTANLSKSTGASPISVITPGGATQTAAVIFVSHGLNGFGSYFASQVMGHYSQNGSPLPFPASMPSCASGGYAVCNGAIASPTAANTNQFYNAPTVIGGSTPYDDILAFADRNSLVSMFGNGSCQTVW